MMKMMKRRRTPKTTGMMVLMMITLMTMIMTMIAAEEDAEMGWRHQRGINEVEPTEQAEEQTAWMKQKNDADNDNNMSYDDGEEDE
jgi:hypothetical protein